MSAEPQYSKIIGTQYEVRVDDLRLYGIYDRDNPIQLGWMTLVPPPGLGGRAVAFQCRIPKGQRFRIIGARRRFVLLENGLYYLLEMTGAAVPDGTPIRLELFRGNEGEGDELNPSLYGRLDRGGQSASAAAGSRRPTFTCPAPE